jgi:hypothetical protein
MNDDVDQDDAANRPGLEMPEVVLRQVVRSTQVQLTAILVDLEQQPEAPFADREWAFFQTLATARQSYADATRPAAHRPDDGRAQRDPGGTDPDLNPLWWLRDPTPEDPER